MIKCCTLSNNIKVVYEQIPYLRSVSIGIWVNVGSSNETKETNGISHVIEHMLFKGTKTKSAKEIADITACLGGNLNAFTSKECTSYYIRTLDKHLFKAIELIADMLINSAIDSKELEKEKCVILDEIDMYEDSPEDMVHEILQKEVWRDNPLGFLISGEKETVSSFTRDDIVRFKNAYYTGDNIVISAAGSFDSDILIDKLELEFAGIKHSAKGSLIKAVKSTPEFNICEYKKYKDIEQVHLDIAYKAASSLSKERYAFSIVNSILGGSVNSRLFQTIREDLGLAYTIYSYGSTFDNAGLFQIYAAMNPKQLDEVIVKTNEVIDILIADKISKDELFKAKEEIITELIINSESTQNRMEYNAKSIMQFGKIITLDETIKNIDNVSIDDIAFIIDKYLNTNNKSAAMIGPYKAKG